MTDSLSLDLLNTYSCYDCGRAYCPGCAERNPTIKELGACPDCEEVFEGEEDYWDCE